ncbi:hypothetical protein V6N13_089776 [Hibiscus sabdariffa]
MDSHKGKEIGKVVEACILQWKIEDKISCLTVDNASLNDVAVLNLIVKDGLHMVKDAITRIRSAVRYVRSSSRAKVFARSSMLVKVSCKCFVCLDVSTRSTYLMLEVALKFEKAFRFKEDDPDFSKELKDGIPTRTYWANARVMDVCLKRFYEATKRLSDDEDVVDKCELDTYLEEAREKRDVDGFQILHWRKMKSEKYKILVEMAKELEDNGPSGVEEVGNN